MYSPPEAIRNRAATSAPASSAGRCRSRRSSRRLAASRLGGPAQHLGQPVPGEHPDRQHAQPDEPPAVVPPGPGQRVHPVRVGAGGEQEQRAEDQPAGQHPAQPTQRADPHAARSAPPPDSAHSGWVNWCGVVISPSCDSVTSSYDRASPGQVGRPVHRLAARAGQRAQQLRQRQQPGDQPGAPATSSGPGPAAAAGATQRCTNAGSANSTAENRIDGFRLISPTSATANSSPAAHVRAPPRRVQQVQQQDHGQRHQRHPGGERQQRPPPEHVVERGDGDRADRRGRGQHRAAAEPADHRDDHQRAHPGQQHGVRVQHGRHVGAGQPQHQRADQVVGVGVEDLDAVLEPVDPSPSRPGCCRRCRRCSGCRWRGRPRPSPAGSPTAGPARPRSRRRRTAMHRQRRGDPQVRRPGPARAPARADRRSARCAGAAGQRGRARPDRPDGPRARRPEPARGGPAHGGQDQREQHDQQPRRWPASSGPRRRRTPARPARPARSPSSGRGRGQRPLPQAGQPAQQPCPGSQSTSRVQRHDQPAPPRARA